MEKKYKVEEVKLYRITVDGKTKYYTQYVAMDKGYAKVMENGKWGILTPYGNIWLGIEFSDIFEFCDDIVRVKKNGKYGFLDRKTGRVVSNCIFDKAGDFKNGLAPVIVDGKRKYINVIGKIMD